MQLLCNDWLSVCLSAALFPSVTVSRKGKELQRGYPPTAASPPVMALLEGEVPPGVNPRSCSSHAAGSSAGLCSAALSFGFVQTSCNQQAQIFTNAGAQWLERFCSLLEARKYLLIPAVPLLDFCLIFTPQNYFFTDFTSCIFSSSDAAPAASSFISFLCCVRYSVPRLSYSKGEPFC